MTATCVIPTCAIPTPLILQGIREFAKRAGAEQGAVTEKQVEAWLAGEKDAQLPPILRGPSEREHSKRHHGKQLEAPAEGAQAAGGAQAALAGGRRQLAAPPAGVQPGLVGLVLGSGQDGVEGSGDRHGRSGGSAGGGSGSFDIQLEEGGSGKEGDEPELSLFAFPAMDNYGGVRCAVWLSVRICTD